MSEPATSPRQDAITVIPSPECSTIIGVVDASQPETAADRIRKLLASEPRAYPEGWPPAVDFRVYGLIAEILGRASKIAATCAAYSSEFPRDELLLVNEVSLAVELLGFKTPLEPRRHG